MRNKFRAWGCALVDYPTLAELWRIVAVSRAPVRGIVFDPGLTPCPCPGDGCVGGCLKPDSSARLHPDGPLVYVTSSNIVRLAVTGTVSFKTSWPITDLIAVAGGAVVVTTQGRQLLRFEPPPLLPDECTASCPSQTPEWACP